MTDTPTRVVLWADTDETTRPTRIPGLVTAGSPYLVCGLTSADGTSVVGVVYAAALLGTSPDELRAVAREHGVELAADGIGSLAPRSAEA